jgi:hypothetical protein
LAQRAITCLALVLFPLVPVVAAERAVEATVLADDGERVLLRFRFAPPDERVVRIDGTPHVEIRLPGEAVTLERGAPSLPLVARSVIVPDTARMEVSVVDAQYEERSVLVAPSKGLLYRDVDPATVPYTFGSSYRSDAFWPPAIVSLGAPYILRDHRGVAVRLNPVQANPFRGLVRVYSEIVVEIQAAGPGSVNVLAERRADRAPLRAFEQLYDAHFLNAATADSATDYPPVPEEGDLLVICHDAWCDAVQPLASHKNGLGIPTTVKPVSEIGNDASAIKDYIQQLYDTSDLGFVLLVGDAEHVDTPIREVGWEDGAADALYSKLAGSDDYPDILVGRFSAQDVDQVNTQVERTIDYENLPATTQDWFWRGSGIASAEGAGQGDEGQSDIQHQSEIRDWLLAAGYTLVDEIYDPGATDDQVADAVNDGRGVMNYTGHGSPTSWGTTGFNNADVNALVNDDELPFIFSVACNNGEFHSYTTCFGEAWLRATNEDRPTGAIAMYASSVSQSWAPPMEAQDEFNLRLTDETEPYHYFGGLCYAGSSSMMDAYGGDGVEMFDTWILFGDPTVRVVGSAGPTHGMGVAPPEGLESAGAAGGPFDPLEKVYTVENRGEEPLEYEVTADRSWIEVIDPRGTLGAEESTEVTVRIGTPATHLDNGVHQGTVQFVNLTDHDGDTSRAVTLRVGARSTILRFDLETDPGWPVEGEWEYGVPMGQGGGHDTYPDPTAGATGTRVFGANLQGNVNPSAAGPFYLTAGPWNLSDVSETRLVFQRWLNFAGAPYAFANVELSTDGVAWTEIWRNSREVLENQWVQQEYDVAAWADGSQSVWVRWGYGLDRVLPFAGSGWNVDDVVVTGLPSTARMTLTVARDRLSWTAVAGASVYDVVRGDVRALLDTGGDFAAATTGCVGDDVSGTELPYEETPASGEGLWLLVRGVGHDGPMTWQALSDSQVGLRDDEIAASGASCP